MSSYGGLRQRGAAAAALTIAIFDSKDGDGPLRRERGKFVRRTVIGSYGGLRQRGAAAAALTIAISDSKDGDGPLRRERGNVGGATLTGPTMRMIHQYSYGGLSLNVAPPPPL